MNEVADQRDRVDAALAQMGFEMVDNGVLELPSSTPATFRFDGQTELDVDAFEDALDERDFGMLSPSTGEKDDGSFYCYADVVTDHYKRVAVKVWNDTAAIYPKEELVDTFEVSRIIHAIEEGFGAELRHDPD